MRKVYPYFLTLAFTVAACSGTTPEATSGTGTDTDTGTGTETGSSTSTTTTTTGASATATTTGGSNSNSNSGTGMACVPGMSVACTCMDGTAGAQVCAPDGMSFEPCECASGSTSDSTTTDPTTSTTDPTTTDATTTDATTGTTDMTTGMVCEDPGPEPNETDEQAVDLGNTMCSSEPGMFEGVLDGDADVDFFHFHGQDGMSCGFADPEASATVTAAEDIQVCVYVDCDQGNNDFNCDGGAQDSMSPGGVPGCCNTGSVTVAYNCSGTMNESANVYISLSDAPADSCVMYSVTWDFAAG